MDKKDKKIESLKKVTLCFEAGTEPDNMNLTHEPFEFEFIFGLGAGGLTPFECYLEGKTEGDKISFCVKPEERYELFQHIAIPLPVNEKYAAYLKAAVLKIENSDNREVIKALAKLAACGEGCCGGH